MPSQSAFPGFPSVVLGSDGTAPDGTAPFGITFTIENIGKAPSHNNHPGLYINGGQVAQYRIGPIDPGKSTTVQRSYNTNLFFSGLGLFDVSACVATRAGTRNCSKPLDFSVIPKRWNVVTFSTTYPFSTQAVRMTLVAVGLPESSYQGCKEASEDASKRAEAAGPRTRP